MEGSPSRKFSFSRRKGVVLGAGPRVLPNGDPGNLLGGTQRPVSCLGSGGIQYLSICPNSLPLIARFRHRSYNPAILGSTQARATLRTWGRTGSLTTDRGDGGAWSCDVPHVDPSLGERTIKEVLKLPIERRQVPLLVSREALERCRIWGEMSGSNGEEALAEYKGALEVMSAKKAAPKRAAPSETEDEDQFVRSSKRQSTGPASSSKKKPKASGSTPKVSPSSSGDPATVLANLNTKVFPLTPVSLPEESCSHPVMSRLFHLGERMDDHFSLQADIAALTSHLREEKDSVLAKEKEMKAFRLNVRNQYEAGTLAASENISLREQLERREEEVCDLRCAAETFDVEKSMARKRESSDKSSKRIATQRPNTCSARSLRSDRVGAKVWSLRSDRTSIPLGRYVATELESKLGRYVATELERPSSCLSHYVATELEPKFGRYVATELFQNVDTTLVHAFSSTLRCYLPKTIANPFHDSPPF
ncbi:hypothetical protein DY000_02007241 [Brassica cretica]|uniref:Uncharacterized protein n=1 Tax=Brassica cretica TaxID=69181 RepID=A0ABQ7C270_BRACR|nr:hypothetical protein DY000_02007241 [Brassica cretica]